MMQRRRQATGSHLTNGDVHDASLRRLPQGHITGARSLPPAQHESAADVLKKYREKLLLLCCEDGNQSNALTRRLHAAGFTKVFNLRGGLARWRADGLPLPKGRMRFYRRDEADGRIEFTGENELDHTAKNEWIRVKTGDAFDVVGERTRTDFQGQNRQDYAEEAFEIKVRNRKAEPVTVRVVEHLFRWTNWRIVQQSDQFTKKDAQTIEFRVTVPADSEKVVTYRVRYDWR